MDFIFSQERFIKLFKQKDIFLKFLIGSFTLNCLQLIDRMMVQDKIILIPPQLNQDVWVMGQNTSPSFIEEWALYMTSILLNMNSQTIDFQHNIVLRYVHPEFSGTLQKQFALDAKLFKDNNMAMLFKPKNVHITQKGQQGHAKVHGTLSTFMGSKRVDDSDKVYILTFQTSKQTPQLSLLSFKEEQSQTD